MFMFVPSCSLRWRSVLRDRVIGAPDADLWPSVPDLAVAVSELFHVDA
jgi:hypothetical protein